MAGHSRWEDIRNQRRPTAAAVRAEVDQDLALGELIYDLRIQAGLSQRALADRVDGGGHAALPRTPSEPMDEWTLAQGISRPNGR